MEIPCKRVRISGLAGLLLLVLLLSLRPANVLAGPSQQTVGGDNGLQVSNALLNLSATPGQVYVHRMVVSIGAGGQALDLTVEPRGLGESLDGAFLPLESAQDTSPYSARSYITAIDKPTFHLEPGGSMPVAVTVSVPQDFGAAAHYAIIYIHSQPVESGGGVGQILAVSVPVVISPQNANLDASGKITELTVEPVEPGKPITILTTVQNNGTRHYKVKGQATITDAAGQTVTDLTMPLTSTSIIPTYAEQLRASYSALDRPNGLEPGIYTVLVKVYRQDDSLVDTAQTTFTVTAPLEICPGVDADHMVVASFSDQEPGTLNGRDKVGVNVTFENTGKVTGQAAICAYTQAPSTSPGFSDKPGNGGTGGTALKYFTVRVDGFNQGVAHVAVFYRPSDLGNTDPNSLFLATIQNGFWTRLDNLAVQTGAQQVLGDISVAPLAQGSLIAMGSAQQPSGGLPLPLILLGIVILLLLLLLVWWLFLRRR